MYHIWLYASPSGAQFDLGPLDGVFRHLPVGVTLFFTLSGFLLYRPFAGALMRNTDRPRLRNYLRNRALRILPAYWVILLFTGVVLQSTSLRSSLLELHLGSLASQPVVLLRNALLIQNYAPSTLLTGIGPAWSLAIEVVFYLVLPLVALIGFTLAARASTYGGRRLAALTPPLALLIVGLSGKVAARLLFPGFGPGTGWVGDWHSVLERSFWAQADLFAFGMALAVLRVEAEDGHLRLPRWWPGAATAGVLLIAVPTAALADRGMIGAYRYDTLMALACSMLLALAVLPWGSELEEAPSGAARRPSSMMRILESRFLMTTGLVSYSLFLWHEPLIRWMQSQGFTFGGRVGFLVDVALIGTISWALAWMTYWFVERPALARKRRPAHRIQHQPSGDPPEPAALVEIPKASEQPDEPAADLA